MLLKQLNIIKTFFVVYTLSLSTIVTATEIEAGKLYKGPTRVSSSIFGLSINIPKAYQGALMGEAFVIEPVKNPQGSIYILAMPMSLQEAQQTMASGFPLGQNIYLSPVSRPRIHGKKITANYRVQGGDRNTKAYVITELTSNGNGIAFIALYKSQAANQFKKIVNKISNSTQSSKPKSSGFWGKALSGRKLIYMYNGRGTSYQERKEMVLCSNGQFYQSNNSSGSSGDAISIGRSGADGRWIANGNRSSGMLYLQFSNGNVAEYELRLNGESLFLNGTKYFYKSAGC